MEVYAMDSVLPKFTPNSVAFAATSLGASILMALFNLYVTDLFTSVYGIKSSHFFLGQVAFAVWNAFNDPIFAWLIDTTTATQGEASSGADRRIPAIKYGGPLWCLAFLLPWWPWGAPNSFAVGLHYCVSLCAFDAFLTYVLLVHCALLADLTTHNTERNNFNNVGNLFGLTGAAIAAASYYTYDKNDLTRFRSFCVCGAALACAGFVFSGQRLQLTRLDAHRSNALNHHALSSSRTSNNSSSSSSSSTLLSSGAAGGGGGSPTSLQHKHRQEGHSVSGDGAFGGGSSSGGGRDKDTDKEKELTFLGFCRQLLTHKAFWLYVSLNFVQNFNNAFDQTFFVFFDEKLLTPIMPRASRALLVTLCLYLPKVMVPILTPIANRYGTYSLIFFAAKLKIGTGLVMLVAGRDVWQLWGAMFLVNALFSPVSNFYNLAFSDVIDEDMLRNRRRESLSVSVHGLQALIVKPAQSLAPILGVFLLPDRALALSVAQLSAAGAESPTGTGGDGAGGRPSLREVQAAAYCLLALVPMLCGGVQFLIWRAYPLHGPELKRMKTQLRDFERGLADPEHEQQQFVIHQQQQQQQRMKDVV